MKKLAVLISNGGSGTNLQAIIDAIGNKKLDAKIVIVVSDSREAYGLERAKKAGVPTYVLKKGESLENILHKKYAVDYVVLSGWKKIIPDSFIEAFPERILNIHPGLIPDNLDGIVKNPDKTEGLWNRGKFTDKAIQNFFDTNATYAGSSIHFLSHEFDFGKVLARCFEKINKTDTVERLYKRLKEKENTILVDVLKTL